MNELSIDLVWTHKDETAFPNGHTITFSGDQKMQSDAAPDWGGSALASNPEQALAAAMASCHMMTFLALAKKAKWPIIDYKDHATAHLGKNPAGKMAVVKINLKPIVSLDPSFLVDQKMLITMHDRAHRYCFIANSMSDSVAVDIEPMRAA
jgi:organic hydroperoxide reductase OsmC/OhrA